MISSDFKMKTTLQNDHYTYRVTWSEEDQEHVALCTEFPSLSWLAPTCGGALKGIRKLVAGVVEDLAVVEPFWGRCGAGAFPQSSVKGSGRKSGVAPRRARSLARILLGRDMPAESALPDKARRPRGCIALVECRRTFAAGCYRPVYDVPSE